MSLYKIISYLLKINSISDLLSDPLHYEGITDRDGLE
jgi:hypothetical protein